MDQWKAERVAYRIGIQNFQSFGLAKTQKSNFHSAAVLSNSSSLVDVQNSVASKPLIGQGCMSKG
jgi:hypothetical protein